MSFPKKGNSFPTPHSNSRCDENHELDSKLFASEVAAALNSELGQTTAHIKIVAAWTGANERTVKNWFAGNYGPSGDHLVTLIRYSDAVLSAVLSMANRRNLLITSKFNEIERRLIELASLVHNQNENGE